MAKNNGAIIESLTAEPKTQVMPKMTKNWQAELHDLSRGVGQGQPALNSSVFSLIKVAIELGELATVIPHDTDALWKAYNRAERALEKTEKTLYYIE